MHRVEVHCLLIKHVRCNIKDLATSIQTLHNLLLLVAGKEGKQMGVPMEPTAFVPTVQGLLQEIQESLLAAATVFRDENIVDVASYDELKAAVAEGKHSCSLISSSTDTPFSCMQTNSLCVRVRQSQWLTGFAVGANLHCCALCQ